LQYRTHLTYSYSGIIQTEEKILNPMDAKESKNIKEFSIYWKFLRVLCG
jgi:hypothetical protein